MQSKSTKRARRTKKQKYKTAPSRTPVAKPTISSYVDSFEWSKTHIFGPEETEDPFPILGRSEQFQDQSIMSSSLSTPNITSNVESLEWSKTYTVGPDASATESPTVTKRAVLPTSSYVDLFEWSKTWTGSFETEEPAQYSIRSTLRRKHRSKPRSKYHPYTKHRSTRLRPITATKTPKTRPPVKIRPTRYQHKKSDPDPLDNLPDDSDSDTGDSGDVDDVGVEG